MDPHLIDLLWEVHREVGAKEPIWIVCGYRSPGTNAMLRRRSSGVAKFSQHMTGKAIDFYIPGVALEDVRAAGLRVGARRRRHLSTRRISFIWIPAACATGRDAGGATRQRDVEGAARQPIRLRRRLGQARRGGAGRCQPQARLPRQAVRRRRGSTRGNDGSSGGNSHGCAREASRQGGCEAGREGGAAIQARQACRFPSCIGDIQDRGRGGHAGHRRGRACTIEARGCERDLRGSPRRHRRRCGRPRPRAWWRAPICRRAKGTLRRLAPPRRQTMSSMGRARHRGSARPARRQLRGARAR